MCFANERGCVTSATQVGCNTRRIFWKRNAVHPHTVSAYMLSGEHGASRWHAHHVLWMCAIKGNSGATESINNWCACDGAAVASECVVTLLIGGDEKNFATHYLPSNISFTLAMPIEAAPAIGSASTSGSMSVEYMSMQRFGPSAMTSTVPK